MLDLKNLNEETLGAIRQNLGVAPDDTSQDEVIAKFTIRQALARFLTWHGIIGWEGTILNAVDDLTDAAREDDPR